MPLLYSAQSSTVAGPRFFRIYRITTACETLHTDSCVIMLGDKMSCERITSYLQSLGLFHYCVIIKVQGLDPFLEKINKKRLLMGKVCL